jgi:hypothetical protein
MIVRLASHRVGRRAFAVLLVAGLKIALRLAPARTLRVIHQSCGTTPDALPADTRRVDAWRRLASSIANASRLMSGTCLHSALASCVGARLLGTPVRLRLGVDQLRPELRAHAWVECAGTVMVGGPAPAAFDH